MLIGLRIQPTSQHLIPFIFILKKKSKLFCFLIKSKMIKHHYNICKKYTLENNTHGSNINSVISS